MFRPWFFGVIISTTIILNIVTGADECAEKCQTLGPILKIQYLPHSSKKSFCMCYPATKSTLENCNSHETWANDLNKCIPDDITKDNQSPCPINRITPRKYQATTECKGECPLNDLLRSTVHLPHKNCQKFCKCDHGIPVVMDCPDVLHFNRILQVCDWPSNANCTETC